jgi:hypothetical protein
MGWREALDTFGFPEGWWFGRQPDYSDRANTIAGHHPFARPLHIGWTRDARGHWVSSGEDGHRWEVICEECGDSDGPVETQSDAARARRGPYDSQIAAQDAATRHFSGGP